MKAKTYLGCIVTFFTLNFQVFSQSPSQLFVPQQTLYSPQNGFLGIGIDTNEPQHPLHIYEDAGKGTALHIDLEKTQISMPGGGISFQEPDFAFSVDYITPSLGVSRVFQINRTGRVFSGYMNGSEQIVSNKGGIGVYFASNNKTGIRFNGSEPQVFWSSSSRDLTFVNLNTSTTPLTLNRNGKVGVNTSNWSSNHNLHVEGGAIADYSVVQSSTDWGTSDDYMGMYFSDNPELRWKSDSTNYFEFKAEDTGEVPLRLTSSGKVGINTDNFVGDYNLYIAGTSVAEEMYVRLQDDWGDFVFEKDYDLMPLAQLDDYLKVYKHLPDFPSAAEVEKDGLALGETERLLTIKVEELTLYILQLKAEIDELKQQQASE